MRLENLQLALKAKLCIFIGLILLLDYFSLLLLALK